MNERDKDILLKILDYCVEIEKTHQYFHDDASLFCSKEQGFVYRNSITMPLLQIGELSKRLSEDFRALHREIPWKSIIRMRDVFAHHYGAVSFSTVWDTSHEDIADFIQFLRKVEQA